MKETIAVDLDGYLTSFGPTGRFQFPKFLYFLFLLVFKPKPNKDNLRRVKKLKKFGFKIVILTARPKITKKITEKWLDSYELEVEEIILVGPGKVKEKKLNTLRNRGVDYYFGDSLETVSYLDERGIYALKG
ncbi:MAG: hypothetical protein ACQEP3_02830 [Patescibacteria group bacterium]